MSKLDDVVALLAAQPLLTQPMQEAAMAALKVKLEALQTQLQGYLEEAINQGEFELRWRGVVLEGGVACPTDTTTFDVKLKNGIYIWFEPGIFGENMHVTVRGRLEKACLYLNGNDWWASHAGGNEILTEEVLGHIIEDALLEVGAIP